jgi:hypothetical protein
MGYMDFHSQILFGGLVRLADQELEALPDKVFERLWIRNILCTHFATTISGMKPGIHISGTYPPGWICNPE